MHVYMLSWNADSASLIKDATIKVLSVQKISIPQE